MIATEKAIILKSKKILFSKNLKHSEMVFQILGARLNGDLIERILDFSTPDKKLTCFMKPFYDYFKNKNDGEMPILDDFVNLFCFGMPRKLLCYYASFLKFGLTYRTEGKNYSNLTANSKMADYKMGKSGSYNNLFHNNFCINGSSLVRPIVDLRGGGKDDYALLDLSGELIHYVFSSEKEIEALNSAIEHVIKEKLNNTFCIDKRSVKMEKNNCKEWEIAQSVYVYAKKSLGQKHKNLHVTKKKQCLEIVSTLVEDVRKVYNYFMNDNYYYVHAEDHYTLKIIKTDEKLFKEKIVYKKQPDVYVPVVKETYHDDMEVPGYGVMLNFKDKEINMEALDDFVRQKNIENKTKFIDLLNSLKKFEIEKDMPKGLEDYDFHKLKKMYNLPYHYYKGIDYRKEMWKIYDILKLDLVNLYKDKEYTYSDDILSNFFELPLKDFESQLKILRPDLKGKQLKKQLSVLKNEVLRKKKANQDSNKTVEYTAIPQPPILVQEMVCVRKTKIEKRLVPKKLLRSEERHQDFIRHEMPPELSILVRNAKHRYTLLRKSKALFKSEYPKLEHLKNCWSALKRISKTVRINIKNRLRAKDKNSFDKAVQKKRTLESEFYKSYLKLKDHMDAQKIESKKITNVEGFPDFNKYDFREINLLKLKLLSGGVCWSRTKLKCISSWNNRKLILSKVLNTEQTER